jgi:hypothetical protein
LDFQVALTESISFLGNELHGKAFAQGPETTITDYLLNRHLRRRSLPLDFVPLRSAEHARPNFS